MHFHTGVVGKRGHPTTTGRHASWTCAIFFPVPSPSSLHAPFLHARTPFPHYALLFTAHYSSPRTSLYRLFSSRVFLHSCSYLDFLRPQFEFLSLQPRSPNASRLKNRNAAFISCKCVNGVISPHRPVHVVLSRVLHCFYPLHN